MTNGNSAPRKAGFRKAGLEKAVEGVQRVAHEHEWNDLRR